MIIYLLKFSACLTIFIIFYKLLLEKASIHKFKRLYLLSALALALVIPSLTVIEYIEPAIVEEYTSFLVPDFKITETLPEIIEVNYTPIILWSLYGLGVFIFLLKFCLNLNNIISRIKSNTKLKSGGFINVLVSNLKIPHTFFSYIFFNKYKFEHNGIPKEVLIHEQTHAKQKHSIDVLLLELLQIIFWFNPLIYLLKREVKLNHEFLADRAVLENGIEPSTYQTILLAFSSKAEDQNPIDIGMANAINYSSIKKRFTVMNTHTSKTRIWLSSLLLLPIIAILFYSFTEKEYVEIKNSNISEVTVNKLEKAEDLHVIYQDRATDAMMKEYKDWVKQLNNSSSLHTPLGTYERMVAIYDLMSEVQRSSVETHPLFQENPNLYNVEPSIPKTAQFESWKNEKEFAIWLDGKHISNSELNNYKINDIAHYVGSNVRRNPQNKKFAQPFQYKLYTKHGLNKFYKEVYVNDYRALTKTYYDLTNNYLKGSQTDNYELRIIKSQADQFYDQFTKEELEKYNLRPVAPVPMEKSSQKGATPNQVAEYNILAKKMSAQPKNNPIIKLKDIKRINYLYKVISATQKESAQPFPNFPPPPPRVKVIKSEKTWILLNSKGQFLMNDQVSSLKSIEAEFKNISGDKNKSKDIVFKHDKDSPKDIINKVNILITNYNLKNIYDTLPPPPPPPATPKPKTGSGPNGHSYYPIPPPIPEDTAPEQKAKMQNTIDEFEKTYKRKVRQAKDQNDKTHSFILNAEEYQINYNQETAIKTGFLKISGTPHYYVSINNVTKYYNRQGFEVDKTGTKISKIQVNASNVVPGQYITKVYSDNKVVSEFKNNKPKTKEDIIDIPLPPKPISTLNFVINLAKKDAIFFFENKELTYDEAIDLLKNNEALNIQEIKSDSQQSQVFISKAPINTNRGKSNVLVKVNGKASKNSRYKLSLKELLDLKLTLKDAQVISFKFKTQGNPTHIIKGNKFHKTVQRLIKKAKSETEYQIFDIKDSKGYKHPSVVIYIKN